jgi:primosomal protein N' (replication factor Y)
MPATCPQCRSRRLRLVGIGVERVEEEAAQAFPGARLLRWDRDVTRGRGAHERILARFLAREADILIGTQMVAKGLDLPLVTLVGAVAADTALFLPDYRAGERAFQLLAQVVGRAGRGERGGRAIIQTYHPDHYAIQAASRHDYESFYRQEIDRRWQLAYPPFGQMIRLLYSAADDRRCRSAAQQLASRLRLRIRQLGLPNLEVMGPSPCFYARLRGRYRWHIILRGHGGQELLRDEPLPLGWRVDVDPVSFL